MFPHLDSREDRQWLPHAPWRVLADFTAQQLFDLVAGLYGVRVLMIHAGKHNMEALQQIIAALLLVFALKSATYSFSTWLKSVSLCVLYVI